MALFPPQFPPPSIQHSLDLCSAAGRQNSWKLVHTYLFCLNTGQHLRDILLDFGRRCLSLSDIEMDLVGNWPLTPCVDLSKPFLVGT